MPKSAKEYAEEYGKEMARKHQEYIKIHPEDKPYAKAGWHVGTMHLGKKWPTPEQVVMLAEKERKIQEELSERKQDYYKQKAHDEGRPTITPRKMRKANVPKER